MSRFSSIVLAFAALAAAVSVREGLAEGVAGPYIEGDEYNHPRPGERPLYGWNPYYYPELYRPEPYIPPGTPYSEVWKYTQPWAYPPTTEIISGGSVIYPNTSSSVIYQSPSVIGSSVVSPATPITTTAIAANALPYTGPGVTIRLEEQVGGSVNYLIDGKEAATIQAGQQQSLTSKGSFDIRFSRGAAATGQSYGEARYTLGEGTYFFTVTERGWDLLRDPSQPAIATPQAKPASPSGLTTTPLPPKGGKQPATTASPATGAPAAKPASDL